MMKGYHQTDLLLHSVVKGAKKLTLKKDIKKSYLGVLIDYKLSWNKDIDTILSKISRTVGLLSKLRHFVPFSTLISIYMYHSLI